MSKYKPYPEYKDSDVEWIGEMPKGWETSRIGNNFFEKNMRGGSANDLLAVSQAVGVILQSEYEKIFNRKLSQQLNGDYSNYKTVNKNDFIYNKMRMWQGAIGLAPCSGTVSPAYITFSLEEVGDPKYWLNLFKINNFLKEVNRYSQGICDDQNSCSYSDFRIIEVPIPPLQEQIQIAAVLDQETARIDKLIAKKEEFIGLLKQKRQVLITHAVTKGLDPNVEMKDSGVEWIGEVPKEWDIASFKFKYDVVLGKMLQPNKMTDEDIQVKYYKAQTIQWERIKDTDISTMWAKASEVEKLNLKKGDLLVCEGGEAGRSAVVSNYLNESVIFQNALHRVRPKSKNNIYWALRIMQYLHLSGWIDVLCNKSTIVHFTSEKLKNLKCPFPPVCEQEDIANYLDKQTARIDTLVSKTRESIELLKQRRQAFITAAVTGKIDLRDVVVQKTESEVVDVTI